MWCCVVVRRPGRRALAVRVRVTAASTVGEVADAIVAFCPAVASGVAPGVCTVAVDGGGAVGRDETWTGLVPHGAGVTVVSSDSPVDIAPVGAAAWLLPTRRAPGAPVAPVPLPPGRSLLGRGPDCDIAVADPAVSRRHVWVDVGDEIAVIPLAGRSFVDRHDIASRRPIRPGSTLTVGNTSFVVHSASAGGGSGNVVVRAPRRITAPVDHTIELDSPPAPAGRVRFPTTTLAVSAALAVAMFAVSRGSLSMSLFYAVSPLFLLASAWESALGQRRQFRDAATAWRATVESAASELRRDATDECSRAHELWPTAASWATVAQCRGPRLWERRRDDPDWLTLRLGTEHRNCRCVVAIPRGGSAELRRWAETECGNARRMRDAPAVHALAEGDLAVTGPSPLVDDVVRGLVGQLAAAHSPDEVAICGVFGARRERTLAAVAWLPHVDAARRRLGCWPLASAGDEGWWEWLAGAGRREGPALVVLVDASAASPPVVSRLVSTSTDGIHVVWLGDGNQPPPPFDTVLNVDAEGGRICGPAGERRCYPEGLSAGATHRLGRALAPLVDAHAPGEGAMAEVIGLLDVDSDASGLTVAGLRNRWDHVLARGDGRGLSALIGVDGSGPVEIDLRRDGPHALVSGTTGSGKSEFLQTLICGLALAHPPERLNFLLVDYKGGAAFGRCASLPHTVGLVTNLDASEVHRTLISLNAELERRMRALRDVGHSDAVSAQLAGHDLASLVIVIDEFAALTREVPGFVDGVVDIAQRGRSLGLHLVLATQRPRGVISDAVRANTNLRISLRTADSDDSIDVIGDDRASRIPVSLPGRAVIRVGTEPGPMVQTGFVGQRVVPATTVTVEGFSIRQPIETHHGTLTSDIDVVVESALAAHGTRPAPRRPWCDPLRSHYPSVDRTQPAVVPLGIADRPECQDHVPVFVDVERSGNVAVIAHHDGAMTVRLIARAAVGDGTVEPWWVYVIDGSGGLRDLVGWPGVGDVVAVDDTERLERLLRTVRAWVDRDRGAWADQGPGRRPRVVLAVDGVGSLVERCERRPRLLSLLRDIAAEGRSAGVHLWLAASRRADIPLDVVARCGTRIVGPQADPSDLDALGIPGGLLDVAPPGRVCIDGIHAAQLFDATTPTAVAATPVPQIGRMPVRFVIAATQLAAGTIGVSDTDLGPATVDGAAGHFLIAGSSLSGRSTALATVSHAIAGMAERHLVALVRRPGLIWAPNSVVACGDDDATSVVQRLGRRRQPAVVAVDDLTEWSLDTLGALLDLMRRDVEGLTVIAAGDSGRLSRFDELHQRILSHRNGLLLQPRPERDGALFDLDCPDFAVDAPPGRGLLVQRGRCPEVVQIGLLDVPPPSERSAVLDRSAQQVP